MQIGLIGLGNIGYSMCRGLTSVKKFTVFAYDRNQSKRNEVNHNYGTRITKTGLDAVKSSELIVLCVKTAQAIDWIKAHLEHLSSKTLILVQSGLNTQELKELNLPNVIRVITNVNVSEKVGHTVVLHNSCEKFNEALSVFNELGNVLIVKNEAEFDEVSLITGCAPAITAMFTKGLESCHNGNIELIVDVVTNSLNVMKKTQSNPYEYANKTYTKGGVFEKCVVGIGQNSSFQNEIKNWLNPLKESLK